MEQWTGSKLGKKYVKAVMQNVRLDEAHLGFKIAKRTSTTSDMQNTTLLAESEELNDARGEQKNLAYNSTFKKQRLWHLVPSLHGK